MYNMNNIYKIYSGTRKAPIIPSILAYPFVQRIKTLSMISWMVVPVVEEKAHHMSEESLTPLQLQ